MNIAYYEPTTIAQASRILLHEGPGTHLLAGGTDLMVRMKRGQWNVKAVVNIKKIPGLQDISIDGEYLNIGALATLTEVETNPVIAKYFPVLLQAAYQMSSWQVRNIATVAGNLCNASPAADLAPPLLCLGAEIVTSHLNGSTNYIPVEKFFVGPGRTCLVPGEIVTRIRVPVKASERKTIFKKLGVRQALDIAIASICVSARRVEDSKLCDVRIAMGSVGPIPMRAAQAEQAASDHLPAQQVAAIAAAEASPIDDVRASKWYREEMIKVLTQRCLNEINLHR